MSSMRPWLLNHKASLSFTFISISLLYYTYHRKKRAGFLKAKQPLLLFQSKPSDNSLSAFLQSIITQGEVVKNIEQCLNEAVASEEMNDSLKGIGTKVIEHLSSNEELILLLKEKLTQIRTSKEVNRESVRFIQFINSRVGLEKASTSLIESVLTDERVIASVTEMAKSSCYKACQSPKVIDSFDSLVKDVLSNGDLLKFIYSKAIDIFSSTNTKDSLSTSSPNESLKF